MVGVGDLNDHRVDHGQVQRRRHPVIQETAVQHDAFVVVYVLFIERPADALDYAALDLAFDVGGVDRFAGVLHGGIAQDLHLAGVRVDLHIDDVDAD